jgi:hypothetical protein
MLPVTSEVYGDKGLGEEFVVIVQTKSTGFMTSVLVVWWSNQFKNR